MFLKMCGMMTPGDIRFCGELGLDAAGIVVEYPRPVPWNVSREAGRRLAAAAPDRLQIVMVCSGTPAFVEDLAAFVRPHLVQIHGEERLEEVAEIVERLRPLGIGVLRALRIAPETRLAEGEVSDPIAAAQAMAEAGVDGIVVDSKVPERPGGTGVAVDMATLRRIVAHSPVPVIAAGGLRTESVGEVIARVRPWGVDVLSGIEEVPGRKDRSEMRRFAQAVRSVWARLENMEARA